MTTHIHCVDGPTAHVLISESYLAKLSGIEQDTMNRAVMNSHRVWIGEVDEKMVAFWGLIPPTLMSDTAYLWLYTTEHFHAHVFQFIRQSRLAVDEMLSHYPTIVGHGVVGNARSLRWLRWLGAQFGEPQGHFLPFTIKASPSWQQDSAQSA